MATGAIITTIIMWLIFIVGLGFCFSRVGKSGQWED